MKLTSLLFIPLSATLCLSSLTAYAQAAPEYRQWTDKASGRQIEASMLSADPVARTVTVQRKDNSSVTLQVARLADADLAYIKAKLSAAPAPAPTATAPTVATPAPAPAPAGKAVASAPAAPVGAPAPAHPEVVVTPAKKFKHPAGGAILGSVKKVRPRILMSAEGFAALKGRVASDPASKAMLDSIQKTCEGLLTLPEVTPIRGEDSPVGMQAIFRFSHFGLLAQVTGDPRWNDRGVKELMALSKDFRNWLPDNPKTCAEFVTGMAIGYDWFRSALTPDQAKTVRLTMAELGIEPLIAHLKGEPIPATAKRPEPGQSAPAKAPPTKPGKVVEDKNPPNGEKMAMACALMLAAISLNEDEPNVANPAANLAAKIIGEGVLEFGPDGIWPESLVAGDEVLDGLAAVISTFLSACGSDFGYHTVEGLPAINTARLYLNGPVGVFNYGSSKGDKITRTWLTSWLASMYGNPGVPAAKAPAVIASAGSSGNLGGAGTLLYHSPYMAGYGTPTALDKTFSVSQVATLRSAWNDPKAMFVGLKGGRNDHPGAQLDLGTFILDAGGVRWGIDLGAEDEKVVKNNADPKRFAQYREGSLGQNIIRMGGGGEDEKKKVVAKGAPAPLPSDANNQSLEAKAVISGFASTPERGVAIVDLGDVFTSRAKGWHRGAMVSRGASPYVVLQDEYLAKTANIAEWIMHTRAEVTTAGNKATLKQGANTLTATILSPKDATFVAADPPEVKEPVTLKGIKLLKILLNSGKGAQTVSVAFALGDSTPEIAVMPLEQWIPKKK